ncbi:MAG TPA: VIT and VWA domain-containing protein [Pyrinomonadaceae bacterium]
MQRNFLLVLFTALALWVLTILGLSSIGNPTIVSAQTDPQGETQGSLIVLDPTGQPKAVCPLKHTTVKAQISGFLSRVNVTQKFENPFKEKIEAVYTFPLPQNAAVDDMTMVVGERTVRGKILRREEARAVYDAAKASGQVAGLLDQERPNVFTQSVANILPGEKVEITISYIETLQYENGTYEFVFPMVVGPRYIPGRPTRAHSTGFAPDTDRVPDASRITPRPVPAGMRVGHDISLDISIDAGVPIDVINSKTHQVDVSQADTRFAQVRLKNNAVIPNKDFILRYDVAGKAINDAVITHRSAKGGFFSLILQPPDHVRAEDVTPKELVFVLDTSGSMTGFPIEKAKETMKLALGNLYPADTFNLITFAGDTRVLFPDPVPATRENLSKAQAFLSQRSGEGGTEMMKAIQAALDPTDSQKHMRIVCFMTDGYVGNEMEIISEIQKHPNARVFAFGIGSSVNRFLLDRMAEEGRGEVEYVGLEDDGSVAARRFHERVRSPLLTDISIDWNGLPVADVYPKRIPDLFSAKPVVLSGRYTGAANGTLKLKGKMSGEDFVREIPVVLPDSEGQHDVLSSLWARNRIDDLMGQDYAGMQRGEMKPELKETITNLGIEYRLMTQFTSFVAVQEMIVTDGGQPRRIDVPIELPEGVSRAALPGDGDLKNSFGLRKFVGKADRKALARVRGSGAGGGVGSGRGSGTFGAQQATITTGPPPPASPTPLGLIDASRESLKVETPADKRRRELLTKVHPSIMAIVDRLKNNSGAPSTDEGKFVRDGKAEIQIWLNEKTPAALASLTALGFETVLDAKGSKLIIGRLPIEKLEKLVELKSVRYVSPQM